MRPKPTKLFSYLRHNTERLLRNANNLGSIFLLYFFRLKGLYVENQFQTHALFLSTTHLNVVYLLLQMNN